ncbi:MAG: hypothetical protein JXA35_09090 [Deltaproteobacteria bacterium]|nr:hypothetical protein [Deltaproteobacteria bacterium]
MSRMWLFPGAALFSISSLLLAISLPNPSYAQMGHAIKIEHSPPSEFVYPESLEFSLKTSEQVQVVKIFFLRPGFNDYQLRIMKKGEDGTYHYRLDTSALTSPEISYYFEIKAANQVIHYPQNAPEEAIILKGTAREPLPSDGIRPQARFTEATGVKDSLPFQLDIDSSSSWETVTHGNAASPFNQDKRFVTDNNVRISKSYKDKDLSVNFYSNAVHTNHPIQDMDRVALTNILLSTNCRNHTLNLGDVSIKGSRFTLDAFGRRGGEYQFKTDNFFFQAFDISSQQQGWEKVIPGSQNNLYGGAIGFNALNDRFSFKTVYLEGKDDPAKGENVSGTYLAKRKGRVLSFIPHLNLFDKKLGLFGEYASSRYDMDTSDDRGMESDDAWRVGGSFTSGYLRFGADYNHIGRDFDSIGNQNSILFTPDREVYNFWAGLSSKKVMLNIKYSGEEDNVEDDPQRSTSTLHNIISGLTFLLTDSFTLNVGYQNSRQETHEKAGGGNRIQEKKADDYSLGFTCLIMPSSSIHGGVTYTSTDSRTDPDTEGNTMTASLGGSLYLGERLSVFPEFSYSETAFDLTDYRTKTYSGFLDSEYFIILKTLSVSTLSSYTRTDSDETAVSTGSDLNREDIQLTGNLNYYLPYFSRILKKSVLSLKGGYIRCKTDAEKTDSYSIGVQFDFSF